MSVTAQPKLTAGNCFNEQLTYKWGLNDDYIPQDILRDEEYEQPGKHLNQAKHTNQANEG